MPERRTAAGAGAKVPRGEPFAPFIVRALWRTRLAALPQWQASGLKAARIAYALVRDVVEGKLALHAASLVYTTMLSLVPILALSFSVLKGFDVHYRFEPLLMQALAPLGSQAPVIAERLMSFVDKMNGGVLGGVGLALLFYTAISVIQKIEAACNEIWHVRRERRIGRKITDYLSVLLIGPVLIFSALGIAASLLASEPVQQLSSVPPLRTVIDLAVRTAPILLVAGAFTFIYEFIPNTRVPLRSAIVGATVAAVIWLLAGMAFAHFAQGASSYTAVYSALASLILFFIWLDVSWLILLVGASAAFYHAHPEYILASREGPLSSRARERLALAIGHIMGKALYSGEGPLTIAEYSRRLRIPEQAVSQILEALFTARLVSRTTAPAKWVPTRPLDAMPVKVLLDAAREHGADPGGERAPDVAKDLEREIDRALDQALSGWTVKDLALGRVLPANAVAFPADRK